MLSSFRFGFVVYGVGVAFLLSGCGGGGGSSGGTVAAPVDKKVLNPLPALYLSPSMMAVSYQGVFTTIPQDPVLYQSNQEDYAAPVEPYYSLSSMSSTGTGTLDTTQKKISHLALESAVYVQNDQLWMFNPLTNVTRSISAPLGLNHVTGSFCGFWESVTDYRSSTNYVVYLTSSSCGSTTASARFYVVSTKGNGTTAPKEIDRPIAALKEGWLVAKTSAPGKVAFYKCNWDCSQEVPVPLQCGTNECTEVVGGKAVPFFSSGGSAYSDYALFAILSAPTTSGVGQAQNNGVRLGIHKFNNLKNHIYDTGLGSDSDDYTKAVSYDDTQYMYALYPSSSKDPWYVCSVNKTTTSDVVVGAGSSINSCYTLSSSVLGLSSPSPMKVNMAVSQGNIVTLLRLADTQSNASSVPAKVLGFTKNTEGSIPTSYTPYLMDQGTISAVLLDRANNIFYPYHREESGKGYYFTQCSLNKMTNCIPIAGYYAGSSTPVQSFLASLSSLSETASDYMPATQWAIATINNVNQTLVIQGVEQDHLLSPTGSIPVSSVYGVVPTLSVGDHSGVMAVIHSADTNQHPSLYGFDVAQPGSLGCFDQC
jgi:hypothetical protein